MTTRYDTLAEPSQAGERVSSPSLPSNGYEVSLIDVLTQFVYHKALIAKVTGIAAVAGFVLGIVLPVKFTATAKLLPPQQTQSTASMMMSQLTGMGGSSFAALAGGGLGLRNPDDIYIGMLTSRPIADAIIQKFDLMQAYHTKDMTEARKELAHSTDVTSEKAGFIAVSVTDRSQKRVAEIANAYVDQLRSLTQTLAVTEASQRRLFYEEQLRQAKDALVTAELAFQEVQQQKGVVQLDAQTRAMIEGIASLRAQVSAKQVEVEALRSYSTEQNPDVQLAEKELASLEGEESRLEQSNHSPEVAGIGLGNVPAAGLEYLRAAHELAYRQTLFDMLMKQYDAARIDEAKQAAIIQVIEPAIEPERKTSPARAHLFLIFTCTGFLVGCLMALVLWRVELKQTDPIAAKQFQELRNALKGLKTADS